jgi:hypothetical protein
MITGSKAWGEAVIPIALNMRRRGAGKGVSPSTLSTTSFNGQGWSTLATDTDTVTMLRPKNFGA